MLAELKFKQRALAKNRLEVKRLWLLRIEAKLKKTTSTNAALMPHPPTVEASEAISLNQKDENKNYQGKEQTPLYTLCGWETENKMIKNYPPPMQATGYPLRRYSQQEWSITAHE
jgi:hypothetical protein